MGSFRMWHHPRGYISNFLVRQASSWCALGRSVTPSTQSRRKDTPVAIRRGEGAQMMWCGEHGCYPRVRPVSWGTLGVPSWVPSTVLHFSRNVGLLLRRCGGQGPHAAKTMEPRGFSRVAGGFSSYDGHLSLPLGLALGSPIFLSCLFHPGLLEYLPLPTPGPSALASWKWGISNENSIWETLCIDSLTTSYFSPVMRC